MRTFFTSLGVLLKEGAEEKLFPLSNRTRDVLATLLDAVHASGGVLLRSTASPASPGSPTPSGYTAHGGK